MTATGAGLTGLGGAEGNHPGLLGLGGRPAAKLGSGDAAHGLALLLHASLLLVHQQVP